MLDYDSFKEKIPPVLTLSSVLISEMKWQGCSPEYTPQHEGEKLLVSSGTHKNIEAWQVLSPIRAALSPASSTAQHTPAQPVF